MEMVLPPLVLNPAQCCGERSGSSVWTCDIPVPDTVSVCAASWPPLLLGSVGSSPSALTTTPAFLSWELTGFHSAPKWTIAKTVSFLWTSISWKSPFSVLIYLFQLFLTEFVLSLLRFKETIQFLLLLTLNVLLKLLFIVAECFCL